MPGPIRRRIEEATETGLRLMADNPADLFRLGYTFANALNAVSEMLNLTRIEEAIVAEQMAYAIANDPQSYSSFNPDPIPNA